MQKRPPPTKSTAVLDAIDGHILQELQADGRLSNLERLTAAAIEAFEGAVRDLPSILDCFYVAGTNDYLIRFTYRDAADLERFHADVLMRLPGVLRSNSMLVLRTVKKTTALEV